MNHLLAVIHAHRNVVSLPIDLPTDHSDDDTGRSGDPRLLDPRDRGEDLSLA